MDHHSKDNDMSYISQALQQDEFDLDILGQQPTLNLYTQLCFCFPISAGISRDHIISKLNKGLHHLVQAAPWVSGDIIKTINPTEASERYVISKLGRPLQLYVRHLDNENYNINFETLERMRYPATLLTEQIYASRLTHPDPANPGTPVFEVQANFMPGGLVLTVVGQHQAMDMVGQESLIRSLSMACRGEHFTEEQISLLNVSRQNIIPLNIDPIESAKTGERFITGKSDYDETASKTSDPQSHEKSGDNRPQCVWVFFTFSSAALKSLKRIAHETITNDFVSTDDALTAFIWQSLIRARAHRLSSDTFSKFGRAVDVRRFVDLSNDYPGLMQCMSHHSRSVSQLLQEPLGSIAQELRIAVDPKSTTLGEDTRQLAKTILQTKDRTKIHFAGNFDPSSGLLLSSWAGVDGYSMDFGLGLGPPAMVRRPSFTLVEGLAYLMPKTVQGDVALMICADMHDIERLRLDTEFCKYATFIG